MASSSSLSRNVQTSHHTEATLHQLNAFRCSKHLCDVTLVVQGREFPAHRAVLAAVGGFFTGLFAAKMREQSENIVNLNEVDPEITEDLLKYIYTGGIELTKDNALSIVKAADFFLLEKLKTQADEFLAAIAKDVSDDYVSNYLLAKQHRCPLFEQASLVLVGKNFAAMYQSDAFLELDIKILQEIIGSDDLEVGSETVVFNAIVKWVKHRPRIRKDCFKQLFSLVRLCSLSEEFLQSVVLAEKLVLSNPVCLCHVVQSMRNNNAPTLAHGQHPRSCLDSYASAILVFPNPRADHAQCIRGPWCYIPSQEKWYQMPMKSANTNSRYGYGQAVFHNGSVLLVKSDMKRGKRYIVIDRYDPQTNTWSQAISIDSNGQCDEKVRVGFLKGAFYLIGWGYVRACDITDVSRSTLTAVPPMAHQHYEAGIVSDDKYLYVLGGQGKTDSTVFLQCVERYDPEVKTWKILSPMSNKSSHLQCTLAHRKIFVSPGLGFCNLDEVYDIISDTWSVIPRAPQRFAMGAMSECDDRIYMIGNVYPAKDDDMNKLYTTSFDLKKKVVKWSPVAAINLKTQLAFLSGIAVRLPKKNIAALQPL